MTFTCCPSPFTIVPPTREPLRELEAAAIYAQMGNVTDRMLSLTAAPAQTVKTAEINRRITSPCA